LQGEESGAEEGGGAIGEYDMEDDFIDDDEFADFVEGDLRKPKESGFFINKVTPPPPPSLLLPLPILLWRPKESGFLLIG